MNTMMLALMFAQVELLASINDAPQVKGDRALLEIMRAVQQANLSSYTSGRVLATVDKVRQATGESFHADVRVSWKPNSSYWEYDDREVNASGTITRLAIRRIDTPTQSIVYYPQDNRMVNSPTKKFSIPAYLLIRPSDCWYRYTPARTWYEMLDPEFGPGYVSAVRVQALNDDLVRFERDYKTGHRLRIDCSLRQGGQVVAYESFPPTNAAASEEVTIGSYEWVPDGIGGYRLKRLDTAIYAHGDRKQPLVRFTVEVHEFDPVTIPPDQQFTLAALKVKPGTQVDEYRPEHRSYLYGIAPPQSVQQQLDELLPALKLAARALTSPSRGP